jgi:hypothetical protein
MISQPTRERSHLIFVDSDQVSDGISTDTESHGSNCHKQDEVFGMNAVTALCCNRVDNVSK